MWRLEGTSEVQIIKYNCNAIMDISMIEGRRREVVFMHLVIIYKFIPKLNVAV